MRTAILIAVVVAGLSSEVAAACKTDDLKGRWHYFAINTLFGDDLSQLTTPEECGLRITKKGKVMGFDGGESLTCELDLPVSFWQGAVLTVGDDCSVFGESEFCDLSGHMSRNGDILLGIGFCGSDELGVAVNDFKLVRVTPTP